MNAKLRYLLTSTLKWATLRDRACPSCGADGNPLVARKYVVTALRRCSNCALLHRTPTSTEHESRRYYQSEYRSGLTTDMPDCATLDRLIDAGFAGSGKDFSRHVAILQSLGVAEGARIVDFGASWGYGTWQFQKAGFHAVGFEVSEPRARFAREELGVDVVSDMDMLPAGVDAFFSSHVMEHVPTLGATIDRAMALLRPGGLFVAITPNGSLSYRARRPDAWQRSWGLKHPNLIDEVFYRAAFAGRPCLVSSELGDHEAMASWASQGRWREGPLDGWELLVACRKSPMENEA